MSVVCDRLVVDPYSNGVGRQGKRKEVEGEGERERKDKEKSNRPGFYIEDEDEVGSDQSSIGVASNCSSSFASSHGDDEEEVDSKQCVNGGLGSFDSLEESLPIKRGLSNFFSGKSKSFTALSSALNSSASDLAKPENPFNKRRRVLLACSRRASCSSFLTNMLPPLLSPQHEVDENEESEERSDDSEEEKAATKPALVNLPRNGMIKPRNGLNRSLISPRSFSLSDLRHA